MTKWLLARLREPSTWRGLVWLAIAAGITLTPTVWESIIAVGMAVVGLIGVLTAERHVESPTNAPPTPRPANPDRMPAPALPIVSKFGVRPPIERPLDDHFSGGWGDR